MRSDCPLRHDDDQHSSGVHDFGGRSIYEISETLKSRKLDLSPTAVREVLKAEGFAALPRRLDEERPDRVGPTVEPVADVRQLSLAPRRFETACGGLFLFVPDLVSLALPQLAEAARLPGSKMIPASHALRSLLVLKLWSIERRSHVMPYVADQGLSLLAGLNVIGIVNEPVAAALYYATAHSISGRVLVYDLGGGTFDVTIMDVDGQNINIICSQGDHALG